MENENMQEQEVLAEQTEETVHTPRPLWQRILAGICLVLFISLILMYYVNIMRGGR